MATLGKINLNDIPVELATPLNGIAITGELTTKVSSGGDYILISLPLYYPGSRGDDKNGVDTSVEASDLAVIAESVNDNETAKAAGLKAFYARWNVKPEWFEAEFLVALRQNEVDPKEKMSYNMNVAGVTRQLFKALGSSEVDFDAVPSGTLIGFKASASKKDPEKLQVRAFFPGPKV